MEKKCCAILHKHNQPYIIIYASHTWTNPPRFKKMDDVCPIADDGGGSGGSLNGHRHDRKFHN